MLALTFVLVAMATVCNAELMTLTASQKQALLDAHNRLRSQTALGETGSQPAAANMLALEWDDRLMHSASTWVQQCQVGHDSYADRALVGYSYVGQNFVTCYNTDFSACVQRWFDEHQFYTYHGHGCSDVCGRYTQLMWAKTTLVGCAVATCTSSPYHLVCNYATAGNFNDEDPYVAGEVASQCSGEYSMKQKGLCIRKDQCTESDCVCTVTSCSNGGTLDSSQCKCTCLSGFYGNKCEKKCEDAESVKSLCAYYGQAICSYMNIAPQCAKTCNLCRATLVRDTNVQNPDAVKSRAP